MKKFIKVVSILLILGFAICACKNEVEPPKEEPEEKTESTELKNIKTTEVRMFNGEFNDKTVVLKVNNDNTKHINLFLVKKPLIKISITTANENQHTLVNNLKTIIL